MAAPPRYGPRKIELRQLYPCPCCHQGQLALITLTEALGCSHCNHIFVLRPNHLQIEQLGVLHLYRRIWFWDGQRWIPHPTHKPKGRGVSVRTGLGVLLVGMFVVVIALIQANRIPPAVGGVMLVLLLLVGVMLLQPWNWREEP